MTPPDPLTSNDAARDGTDRALRIGTALLLIGVIGSVVTLVPFLIGADPLPLVAYLVALLAPVGLAVVLIALARRARGRRARLAAASAPPDLHDPRTP